MHVQIFYVDGFGDEIERAQLCGFNRIFHRASGATTQPWPQFLVKVPLGFVASFQAPN